MKALIRKIARWISGWPVVAPIVRRVDCIIRLPDFETIQWNLNGRRQEFEVAQLERWQAAEARLSAFEATQLTQNGRWEAWLPALDNLIQSMPVALRTVTRNLIDIRTQSDAIRTKLDDIRTRLDNDLQVVARDFVGIQTRLDDDEGRIQDLRGRVDGIGGRTEDIGARLENTLRSVGYLLGRVEFVRRELMFEMRYGGSAPGGDNEIRTKTQILSPDKLEAARGKTVRLNLGCGHVPLDGYLNVDRRALPGVDIVAEADSLPVERGEVDEIFSAHMLEHFPQEQLRRELLPYWYSLLKSGGIFAAIVPDADGMINAYTRKEYPFERIREVTYGAQDYDGDFHFNMFTTGSLSALLTEAGFSEIKIVAENRENGGCKEFEIQARRPDDLK